MFEFFEKAWDWINTDAGMKIGGAIISGLGAGYVAKEKMKMEERRLEQEARFQERRPSSGKDNYNSHITGFGGGTGLLSNPQYMQFK